MFRSMRRRALVINRHQEACASALLDFLEGCCCCGSIESQMAAAKYDLTSCFAGGIVELSGRMVTEASWRYVLRDSQQTNNTLQRVDRN